MRAENELLLDNRRMELGDFLRRRRAELTTEMVGLPATLRRRTPGLRREEVAELANISTALYAWLEQGRDVPISRRTIEAIAVALKFNPGERDHVISLATYDDHNFAEYVSPTLERMIGALRTQPVFVINHTWDAVLINTAAQVIFPHDDARPMMNLLATTFSEKGTRLFTNWREVAASLVELFRYDYALYADDAATLMLVDELRASNADFAAIWDEHRVNRTPGAICRLDHPQLGVLPLEPSMYAVSESPGLRCMIFTPADDETAHLIDGAVTQNINGSVNPGSCTSIRLR